MTLAAPALVFTLTLAVAYGLKRALFAALRGWSQRSSSRLPDTLRDALNGTVMIWALILAIHLAAQSSELPARATHWIGIALMILWIFSLTLMLTRLAGNMIRIYGTAAPGAITVTSLTQNLAQLGIVILGIMVLLNQLGIPITPILTALGVGGLAVALALQDTLSNLFAGFYIAVAAQVRVGDYIKLNTGEEGYVTDITWRSTMIRALSNNLIIVPNNKLAQAVVTNFHLPEKRMASSVRVNVAYTADFNRVESVLAEVAQTAAREVPGMLAEPAPNVRFDPGFTDAGLGFSVNYQVAEFVDQFQVQHELRTRIYRRFRQEKIPFQPASQTVLVSQPEPREDK